MKRPTKTKAHPKARAWRVPGFPPTAVAFLVLGFVYVWLRIEPVYEYHRSAPAFFWSHSFFSPFLARPGGLTEYGAAVLAQANGQSWLGALVFTALGGLLFLATRWVLHRMSGVTVKMAALGPVFLLLLLRNRPDDPSLAVSTGMLAALGWAMGYLLLPWTRTGLRLAACWVFAALLSYGAGLWSCLLFVLLAGLFEVVRRREWLVGLGCVASALVAPVWMLCFGHTDAAKLLNPWADRTILLLAAALHLIVPLAAAVLALLPPPVAPTHLALHRPHGASTAVPTRRWFQSEAFKRALGVGLFLVGWVWVWLDFDGSQQAQAQVDYYAGRREYGNVLAAATRLQAMDTASEVRLHRALYHTGRLGEDLFSFTNQTFWTLLPALSEGLAACRPQSETLLELGQVNLAEHFAHEALEWEGDRPDVLWLLARVNVLKDRPRAARVFLNVLRQVPFQREEAEAWLRKLEADPRLPDDHELAEIRSRMISADLPHVKLPTESVLRHLLRVNRQNQMAFEYLMAHYLLTGQVDRIVEEIGRLNDFKYVRIPRHYEEALLLYQQAKDRPKVDLQGRQIRPETVRRFQQFSAGINRRAHESAAGRLALAREFGDTFWYQYLSGRATLETPAAQPAAP